MEKNKKNSLILGAILGSIIFIILFFVYKDFVNPARNSRMMYVDYTPIGNSIEVKTGDKIKQEITMKSDSFEMVGIGYKTAQLKEADVLVIRALDSQKEVQQEWKVSNSTHQLESVPGTNYLMLQVAETVHAKVEEKWILELEIVGTGQSKIELLLSSPKEDVLKVNEKQDGTLAIQILGGAANGSLYVFIVFVCGIILVLGAIISVLWKKVKIEQGFAVFAFLLGGLYLFYIAPYSIPDEEAHFITAYSYSSRLLGEEAVDEEGRVLLRSEDMPNYLVKQIPTKETYIFYLKGLAGDIPQTLDGKIVTKGVINVSAISYLPQIIGITFARILNLNGVYLFFIGRMFALLGYIFICYWAIKKMPFAKIMLALIALLPMALQQAVSFSYDMMINAISFFLIAYLFYLIYEKEKVEVKDVIVLLITTVILSPIKVVYAVIIGLGILIPYKKFGSKKRKWLSAFGLGLAGIGSILYVRLVNITDMVNTTADKVIWTGEPGYSFEVIAQKPYKILGLFCRTTERMSSYYWDTMIGDRLGWLDIQIPNLVIIGFTILILISILMCPNEKQEIRMKSKLWIFLLVAICVSFVWFALIIDFTRLSSLTIEGVQGRYFIAILPMFMLLFRNNKIQLQKRVDQEILIGAVILNLWTLITVFETVIAR